MLGLLDDDLGGWEEVRYVQSGDWISAQATRVARQIDELRFHNERARKRARTSPALMQYVMLLKEAGIIVEDKKEGASSGNSAFRFDLEKLEALK